MTTYRPDAPAGPQLSQALIDAQRRVFEDMRKRKEDVMAKSKSSTRRTKKTAPRAKHVKVLPGQELHVHVVNARGKEIGVQVTQANKDGQVQPAAPPVAEPGPISETAPES